jgi:aspartyl protease family protein
MLALLLIVVVVLAGGLAIQASGLADLGNTPAIAIAVAVIAALALVYFAAVRSDTIENRALKLWLLVGLLATAIIATGLVGIPVPSSLKAYFPVFRSDESPALRRTASVRIRRHDDGKFLAHAKVNGEALDMIVDTGAASVVLKQSDAVAAGIDVAPLAFDVPLKTANGTSFLASVRLKSVSVGPLVVTDVEALVGKPGTINESLLGLTFLRRLASYEIAGDFVTLRQ